MLFQDRSDAGRVLAERLGPLAHRPDMIVLGLPRGGIPVAFEIAAKLGVPLDVFVVRKLGVPGQEELAMGAIATGGVRVVNEDVTGPLNIPDEAIEKVAERERVELARREQLYRGDRAAPTLSGKTVILVDDGLATGSTMRAAVRAVRQQRPKRVIVVAPVAAASTCTQLESEADEVICPNTPEYFSAVGQWYFDFSQTSDAEVRDLLDRARARHPSAA